MSKDRIRDRGRGRNIIFIMDMGIPDGYPYLRRILVMDIRTQQYIHSIEIVSIFSDAGPCSRFDSWCE